MSKNLNNKYPILYSAKIRRKFLDNSNSYDLNKYLIIMDNLAKKNYFYKKMLEEDLNYLLQKGGMFTNAVLKVNVEPIKKRDIFKDIGDLTPNSYCTIITQKDKSGDQRCEMRFLELDIIKKVFDDVVNGILPLTMNNKKLIELHIRRFIEILICCADQYVFNEVLRKSLIIPLTKIVANSPILTNIATKYINWILVNEKGKYIKEYRKIEEDIRRLKRNKKQDTEEFKKIKQQKQKMIDKYGAGLIYVTKLINWIYNEKIKDALISI